MTLQNILKESINKNPTGLKEILGEELMSRISSKLEETLTYIPPNVSHEEFLKRNNKLKDELENHTGLKYNSIGTGYNSDKTGNSQHLLMSKGLIKNDHHKTYGGAMSHTVQAVVNPEGKVLKIHSIVHQVGSDGYGGRENKNFQYDHKEPVDLKHAVEHMRIYKDSDKEIPAQSERYSKILHPSLYK